MGKVKNIDIAKADQLFSCEKTYIIIGYGPCTQSKRTWSIIQRMICPKPLYSWSLHVVFRIRTQENVYKYHTNWKLGPSHTFKVTKNTVSVTIKKGRWVQKAIDISDQNIRDDKNVKRFLLDSPMVVVTWTHAVFNWTHFTNLHHL